MSARVLVIVPTYNEVENLERILERLQASVPDADALVAHGRFLAEKFGSTSTGGALHVGSAPVPAMPGSPDAGRRATGAAPVDTTEDAGGPARLQPPAGRDAS